MIKKFWTLIVLSFFVLALPFIWADNSWLDKFIPKKTPQFLTDKPSKPLVEPPAALLAFQDSFAAVAKAVKPAVVNISAVHIQKVEENPHQFYFGDPEDFFYRYFGEGGAPTQPQRKEYKTQGTGSGVIIDPDGYILTNNHVVQGADQLTVTLESGKSFKGKVIGTDSRSDLAVIKIKAPSDLKYIPLGDSASIRIGDWVMAVGSPFGLEQTVTAGIISAVRQSLNIEGKIFPNLIQTDAAINRGNSGGPMVNLRGELIGINTAIYAPTGVFSGIGFAIPVNEAKKILQQLISKGYVERSWLGVEIAEIDDVLAQQFGLSEKGGALINKVLAKSPAEKASIKRGDIITEIEGKKIKNIADLQETIANIPPKTEIKIKLVRNGSSKNISLMTEIMPKQSQDNDGKVDDDESSESLPEKTTDWLGAQFSDVSAQLKRKYDLSTDSNDGIIAVKVPAESVAADIGIQEGDLIFSVNKSVVSGSKELRDLAKKVDLKNGVVLDVQRAGQWFYLTYKSLQ